MVLPPEPHLPCPAKQRVRGDAQGTSPLSLLSDESAGRSATGGRGALLPACVQAAKRRRSRDLRPPMLMPLVEAAWRVAPEQWYSGERCFASAPFKVRHQKAAARLRCVARLTANSAGSACVCSSHRLPARTVLFRGGGICCLFEVPANGVRARKEGGW